MKEINRYCAINFTDVELHTAAAPRQDVVALNDVVDDQAAVLELHVGLPDDRSTRHSQADNVSSISTIERGRRNVGLTDTAAADDQRVPAVRSRPGSVSGRRGVVSNRKAVVVLASILVAFAVCWVPYFVLFTVRPFLTTTAVLDDDSDRLPMSAATPTPTKVVDVVDAIPVVLDEFCLWLGYANSFINPFLYAFYNSAFRNGMWRLLSCNGRCRRRQMT